MAVALAAGEVLGNSGVITVPGGLGYMRGPKMAQAKKEKVFLEPPHRLAATILPEDHVDLAACDVRKFQSTWHSICFGDLLRAQAPIEPYGSPLARPGHFRCEKRKLK